MALGEDDEGLHDVALDLVGRGDRRRLAHRLVLQAGRLDLEGADAVAGGDDDVVGAPGVPDVAVLVLHGGVLGVKPLAAEGLLGGLGVAPVAERIVGIRARAQADLAALALGHGALVLVEELDVPARHGPAHRTLAHLEERVVGHERVALGQPVVVEHREPVLLAEPADRLGVEGLAGRAHAAEALRVARAGVLDGHHRPHRRRGREDVRDLVAAEEVELLGGVEAPLALQHDLDGAQAPRPEQRRDAGRPRPLPHAVEELAVLDLVAVDELLVREHVAMRVDDALGQAGGAARVVELRRVVGGGVGRLEVGRGALEQPVVEHEDLVDQRRVEARRRWPCR